MEVIGLDKLKNLLRIAFRVTVIFSYLTVMDGLISTDAKYASYN
jgi:hypothetical protein